MDFTLLKIVLALAIVNTIIVLCYRKYLKKELKKDLEVQMNA